MLLLSKIEAIKLAGLFRGYNMGKLKKKPKTRNSNLTMSIFTLCGENSKEEPGCQVFFLVSTYEGEEDRNPRD